MLDAKLCWPGIGKSVHGQCSFCFLLLFLLFHVVPICNGTLWFQVHGLLRTNGHISSVVPTPIPGRPLRLVLQVFSGVVESFYVSFLCHPASCAGESQLSIPTDRTKKQTNKNLCREQRKPVGSRRSWRRKARNRSTGYTPLAAVRRHARVVRGTGRWN